MIKGGMGSERRLFARECWHGGTGVCDIVMRGTCWGRGFKLVKKR